MSTIKDYKKYTSEELDELPDESDGESLLAMEDEDIIINEDSPNVIKLVREGKAKFVSRKIIKI